MAIEQLSANSSEGATVGKSITDKASFYGVTPIAQRAGAAQNSAASYVSATANTVAIFSEISATLTALGMWKGAA